MKTGYWPWQNPSYPENIDLSPEDMEQWARDASMARAHSPNPLICKLDGEWSIDDPFHHHGFSECMDYRHAHVIGDNEPWTNWWTLDDSQFVPARGVPALPVGTVGWQLRASAIDPTVDLPRPPVPSPTPPPPSRIWQPRAMVSVGYGYSPPPVDIISTQWAGLTLVQKIASAVISPQDAGFDFRIMMYGGCTINKMYVGPCQGDSWIADSLEPVTFNGGNTSVVTTFDGYVTSDPLGHGIDGSNGLMISCYFDPGAESDLGGTYTTDSPGWEERYTPGDFAANKDKSDTTIYSTDQGAASYLIVEIDGLYAPLGPAPIVLGVNPNIGPMAGGDSVVITGNHFLGATNVNFGSVPATTMQVNTDTQISVTSPPMTSPGTVDVTVITPGGQSAVSTADHFTYTSLARAREPQWTPSSPVGRATRSSRGLIRPSSIPWRRVSRRG